MTQDERNMLTDLANKIAQTPPPPKDAEAEELIRTKIGSRPDALYLMTQTVLIQDLALQHAQQQIQDLQQQAGSPQLSSGGGFLGQGAPAPPRGYAQSGAQQQYAPQPQYAPQQQYAPPQPLPNPSGASGFLRGAAQTAAGVAAGGLAMEAISSLFSHHGYGGGGFFGGGGFGGGGFGAGGFGGAPVEETVVNNYYDQPAGGDDRAEDAGNYDDASNVNDSSQDDNSSYDSGDDGGSFDDNSGDNFS
jgi:hypothetical protein